MKTGEKLTILWLGIAIVGIIIGAFSKDLQFVLSNIALSIALGLLIISERELRNIGGRSNG